MTCSGNRPPQVFAIIHSLRPIALSAGSLCFRFVVHTSLQTVELAPRSGEPLMHVAMNGG